MEKKLYIQPALTVVNVALGTLLGSSTTPTYSPTESFGDEEKVGSRRHTSLWDDDEEE